MQLRSVLQAAAMELKQEGREQTGAVSIAVLGATVQAGADDRYAVYQLHVSEGADSWLLLRRWSELRALERALAKQRPPGLAAAPRLPRWLDLAGSLEAPFLVQRCGLLGSCLQGVLATCPVSMAAETGPAPLLGFLAPDEAAELSPPPSSSSSASSLSLKLYALWYTARHCHLVSTPHSFKGPNKGPKMCIR